METETARMNRPPIQRPSSTDKSKMYLAGLRQLGDQTLTKKNSSGNPIDNRKSITGFIDDSEDISDL